MHTFFGQSLPLFVALLIVGVLVVLAICRAFYLVRRQERFLRSVFLETLTRKHEYAIDIVKGCSALAKQIQEVYTSESVVHYILGAKVIDSDKQGSEILACYNGLQELCKKTGFYSVDLLMSKVLMQDARLQEFASRYERASRIHIKEQHTREQIRLLFLAVVYSLYQLEQASSRTALENISKERIGAFRARMDEAQKSIATQGGSPVLAALVHASLTALLKDILGAIGLSMADRIIPPEVSRSRAFVEKVMP